jgi:hypothetical protein
MKIYLSKEYWVLADREKEYFLVRDEDGYCDWTTFINQATKFESEYAAIMLNKTRNYELVEKDEVVPVQVDETYSY